MPPISSPFSIDGGAALRVNTVYICSLYQIDETLVAGVGWGLRFGECAATTVYIDRPVRFRIACRVVMVPNQLTVYDLFEYDLGCVLNLEDRFGRGCLILGGWLEKKYKLTKSQNSECRHKLAKRCNIFKFCVFLCSRKTRKLLDAQ